MAAQTARDPDTTPYDELTEKDLLVAIYKALRTIRVVLVLAFLIGVIAGLVLLVQAASGDSGY